MSRKKTDNNDRYTDKMITERIASLRAAAAAHAFSGQHAGIDAIVRDATLTALRQIHGPDSSPEQYDEPDEYTEAFLRRQTLAVCAYILCRPDIQKGAQK